MSVGIRHLLWFGVIVSGITANAQSTTPNANNKTVSSLTVSKPIGMHRVTQKNITVVTPVERTGVATESFVASPSPPSRAEYHPGVLGATIGAAVGASLGYLRMRAYCESDGRCDATRDVLTGAIIGATIGIIVEYFVRNSRK
jgi:hypothetical protein